MMILRSTAASPFGRKVRIAAERARPRRQDRRARDRSQRSGRLDPRAESARKNSGADPRRRHRLLRLARDRRISRSSRRRRPHHSARAQGALRGAAAAGAVRRHSRCQPADRLREPLPSGRQACAELARSPGRQGARGTGGAGGRAAAARRPCPMSDRSRSPALLGYRDLRFGGTWRKDHPRLLAWHDKFAAQVPAFAATKIAP